MSQSRMFRNPNCNPTKSNGCGWVTPTYSVIHKLKDQTTKASLIVNINQLPVTTVYLFNFSGLIPSDAAMSSYSKHRGQAVSRPALVVRGALLMTSYLLALLVPRFSLLMGLTGSVTGAAMTLILPCLFHLRLQWSRLTVKARLIDVGILSLGVICSVSGVICSVKRLLEGL